MTAIEFQYELTNLDKSLRKFAYSLTTNKEDALDLVQETYLKALKNQDKYVHETNFKAWIFTILKNTFINAFHRKRHYKTYYEHPQEAMYLNYFITPDHYGADSQIKTKDIENIIDSLDEDYKKPLKMHCDGFKYKEIAEELDLRIGTVKSRIFLSRQKLKKIIEPL